jgi:hypothetical protein
MTGPDYRELLAEYEAFMELPFPDRPRGEELREWASSLVLLGSHVGPGVIAIRNRRIDAWDIPNLESVLLKVQSLRRALEEIHPELESDVDLLSSYRIQVARFEPVVEMLVALARQKPESPAPGADTARRGGETIGP